MPGRARAGLTVTAVTRAEHVPVMVERVLALLAPAMIRTDPPPVLVDATLGLGGHAQAVLDRFPEAIVIGIDRDSAALEAARERLSGYGDRLRTAETTYDRLPDVLAAEGLAAVDAVLFDLGVSSMQLDRVERGFSYAHDAPLDMRMGDTELTAADIVNTYSAKEIARILRTYGEERFARRIADAIVAVRDDAPFHSSEQLVALIREQIPAPARRSGGNPAKRTFQALRIAVNDELEIVTRAIPASLEVVATGGRIVVMAYHSLEDRIVKRAFTAATTSSAPVDLPVVPAELRPHFGLVTRGAEQADPDEVAANPRARSVRVRAVERLDVDREAP